MSGWIEKLAQLRSANKAAVIVTVSGIKGSTPREVGAKMVIEPSGAFWGTIGGGRLEQMALEEAKLAFAKRESFSISFPLGAKTGQCCGGSVDLLFEIIGRQPELYLFGAGHVGQAICRTLDETPFRIHLIDEREEWVHSPNLPDSVIRHCCDWEDFVAEADWSEQETFVAVMTHRHDRDQQIIEALVRKPFRYFGLIGSSAKWKRFQSRLRDRGFSDEELQRVKCPIGIPLPGKSPKEIAISFAAEVLQIAHD